MSRFWMVVLLSIAMALPSLAAEEKKPEAGTGEVKGLSLSAKPAKAEFDLAQGMMFDVALKNTSDKAFQLYEPDFYVYDVNLGTWQCVLKSVETKKEYRPGALMRTMLHRIPRSVGLEPGKTHTTKMTLGPTLSYPVIGENPGGGGFRPGVKMPGRFGPRLANQPLPGGKYTLAVTAVFKDGRGAEALPPGPGDNNKKKSDAPFWTGSISVETAPFSVAAAKVADLPKPNPGGWVKLFADEGWYKNQKGPERQFTGVLSAIKQDPNMATTLQRKSLYSLDSYVKRVVYTGAKNVDALDALVGKTVTIRGKVVNMELEGRALREIWPASVKERKEPLRPIEIHPNPPDLKSVDPPAEAAAPNEGDKMGPPVVVPPIMNQLPAKPEPIRPPVELDRAR